MISALSLDYCRADAVSRLGVYLLVAALLTAAHVAAQYRSARNEVARKEHQLAAHATPRTERPAQSQPVNPDEYAFASETIRRLSMPWTPLFRALESANTERVALLAVEPNVESGAVTVTGEAKDYLVTLTYVARLAEQEPLKRVHLVRHETRRDLPRRPITFTISAAWRDG